MCVIIDRSRSWARVTVLRRPQRVAAPDRGHQWLGGDHPRADLGRRRLSAHPDDRGVHVAVGDRFQERFVLVLADRDLDRGMRAMEVP
jgi:hypothetical protein